MHEQKDDTVTQIMVFFAIREQRIPYSFISGLPLHSFLFPDMELACFIHVLPKDLYPEFKCYAKNIVLGTPQEHIIYDRSDKEAQEKYKYKVKSANWEKLHKLREELLNEHQSRYHDKATSNGIPKGPA